MVELRDSSQKYIAGYRKWNKRKTGQESAQWQDKINKQEGGKTWRKQQSRKDTKNEWEM
jgi:hypothetical protein